MMDSIGWHIFNGIVLVAWIACIVSWVMRGCTIPRWLHAFAGCLLFVGVAAVIILAIKNMLKLATSCILVPPAAAYIGWLWMFGPSEAEDQRAKESQNN